MTRRDQAEQGAMSGIAQRAKTTFSYLIGHTSVPNTRAYAAVSFCASVLAIAGAFGIVKLNNQATQLEESLAEADARIAGLESDLAHSQPAVDLDGEEQGRLLVTEGPDPHPQNIIVSGSCAGGRAATEGLYVETDTTYSLLTEVDCSNQGLFQANVILPFDSEGINCLRVHLRTFKQEAGDSSKLAVSMARDGLSNRMTPRLSYRGPLPCGLTAHWVAGEAEFELVRRTDFLPVDNSNQAVHSKAVGGVPAILQWSGLVGSNEITVEVSCPAAEIRSKYILAQAVQWPDADMVTFVPLAIVPPCSPGSSEQTVLLSHSGTTLCDSRTLLVVEVDELDPLPDNRFGGPFRLVRLADAVAVSQYGEEEPCEQ